MEPNCTADTPITENLTLLQKLSYESRDLNVKIGKLVKFLGEQDNQNTPAMYITNAQDSLLRLQLTHMKHYSSCLNLRIAELQSNEC